MADPTQSTLLARLVVRIDRFTDRSGRALAWLNVALVLVMFSFVILRYFFNYSPIAVSETALYLHGMLFLLGAAYTLRHDGHVRVDIFYHLLSARSQAWINLTGTLLFLFPIIVFIGISSWPPIQASWRILEVSPEPGGLPLVYVQKSLVLGFVALMLIQGSAELLRNIGILSGQIPADGKRHGGEVSE